MNTTNKKPALALLLFFFFTSGSDLSNQTNVTIKLTMDDDLATFDNDSLYEPTLEDIMEYIRPKAWTWPLIVLHVGVFVVGFVGNCLVCVAVYRNHSMRTVTNYFIVNLAVGDALVILFCLPFSVIWDITSTWWFGNAMCTIVLSLQSLSVTVSILTLAFISIDRWYAICYPLKFKSTTGRAKTAIAIIWTVSLVCEIPESIFLTAQSEYSDSIYFTQCAPTWSTETDAIYMMAKMILLYVLPLLLMTLAYVQIIKVLWKSGKGSHQVMEASATAGNTNTFAMNMNTSTEGQLRSRRKAAKMLVVVVVMFAICFLPVHLLNVLRVVVHMDNSEMNRAFSLISHWLCYANSAVNPIIYNFMSGKFRKEFRRAFEKCCQQRRGANLHYSETFSRTAKDGFTSRTQSRTDLEVQRLRPIRELESKHVRKGTMTSAL